jgi:hypothetical protein
MQEDQDLRLAWVKVGEPILKNNPKQKVMEKSACLARAAPASLEKENKLSSSLLYS